MLGLSFILSLCIDNLLLRAADATLKEGRKMVLAGDGSVVVGLKY